jgi:hypothetical protein
MKTKEKKRKDSADPDLHDAAADREKLRPDTAFIDLPDVKDIPGQEYIKPPTVESYVDETISSADEEGTTKEKGPPEDDAVNVMEEEDEGLNDSTDSEDFTLKQAALDNTDDDGDPLNEKGFGEDLSGEDLDVPGADEDDEEEDTGEEDEENNVYSEDNDREDEIEGKD